MEVPKPKDIPPIGFDEDQKFQYEMFLRSARLLFPEMEDWTLKLAIECYVRNGCKDKPVIDKEEIAKFKNQYEHQKVAYETVLTDEEKAKYEEEFRKNNPDNKVEFLGVKRLDIEDEENNISIQI